MSDQKPCSFQEGQTACTPCQNGLVSKPGSTSADSCMEQIAGVNCWKIRHGISLTALGSQSDALSFEEVYMSCSSDADCEAVKCKRETQALSCNIGPIVGEVVNSNLCRYDKN